MNKLGIRLTPEKQQAVLRGDTSGTVIHPFFIFCAQALGMYFCEGMDDSLSMIRLQARYLQMSFESLAEIFKGPYWDLKVQVALWIITGSITLTADNFIFSYMQKSCEVINAAGLRFIPAHGRPPEFSEDLHERLSVLSQVIYFENFLFLTCGRAEPTMAARIENEFRYQLPV